MKLEWTSIEHAVDAYHAERAKVATLIDWIISYDGNAYMCDCCGEEAPRRNDIKHSHSCVVRAALCSAAAEATP